SKAIFETREKHVTGNHTLDEREVQIRTQQQGLLVNLRAATNKDVAGFAGWVELGQPGDNAHAWILEIGTAQNDGFAVGQRPADGLKGLASHYDYLSRRHFLEPLEIFRQMPGNSAALTDHTVLGHGGNGFEVFHYADNGARNESRAQMQSRFLIRGGRKDRFGTGHTQRHN